SPGVRQPPGPQAGLTGLATSAQEALALMDSVRRTLVACSARFAAHPFGPAWWTPSVAWAPYVAKFFWKRAASWRALASYSFGRRQVPLGWRISGGTPGHAVGTSTPKTGSGVVGTLAKLPLRAARTRARVCASLIQLPWP